MSGEYSPVTSNVDFDKPGKQITYLKVPHSRNDSAWGSVLIPIIVVKNAAGPTVYLNGGSHGGEYEGPVCLTKLGQELRPDEVQGTVIIIPALNLPAVMAGTRLSPIDHKDINRVFPGQWNGSITQIIAHYVHEMILPRCDAVLDIHSGGYSLDLMPYISMHYLENSAQRKATFEALKAFNAPLALIMNEFTGAGLLDYAVENMGKVFLCAELGGAGRLPVDTLKVAEVGTRNFLKSFGIIEGEIESSGVVNQTARYMEIPDPQNYHMALSDGIYETFYRPGEWVREGQTLGKVHFVDRPERASESVMVQTDGMIIGIRAPGQVHSGDCVAVVAKDLDNPDAIMRD